nr:rhodanese-like domain-containing protein [Pelistega europaea]
MLLWGAKKGGSGKGAISAKEAVQLSNTEHAQFIDIRSEEAFKKASVPQSKHFPQETILEKIGALPKKPLILVCDSGRTAAKVAQQLIKNKVEQVYWIKGGINEWTSEGYPVKSPSSKK